MTVEVEDNAAIGAGVEEVAGIEQAPARLNAIRPRLRAIVELRVFEGLTGEEIAERLRCAPVTVAREWNFAKHWLQKELSMTGFKQ